MPFPGVKGQYFKLTVTLLHFRIITTAQSIKILYQNKDSVDGRWVSRMGGELQSSAKKVKQ